MNNTFLKKYISEIVWAILITLFEISILAGSLFILLLLPHSIPLLSLSFFQCFVIITAYRIITYKIQKNESHDTEPEYQMNDNRNMYDEEPLPTLPVKNVYPKSDMEAVNEPAYSVRE